MDIMEDRNEYSPSRRQLWQLRHHMGHFITNLQIYLQVDVIESNFSLLKEAILNSQDFMKAAKRHEESFINFFYKILIYLLSTSFYRYLQNLLIQAFLLTQTVSQHISTVFDCCKALFIMIQMDDGSDDCEAAQMKSVDRLKRDFNNAVTHVYLLLQSSRLQERSKGTFLRQFFLRLNYNEYVSK